MSSIPNLLLSDAWVGRISASIRQSAPGRRETVTRLNGCNFQPRSRPMSSKHAALNDDFTRYLPRARMASRLANRSSSEYQMIDNVQITRLPNGLTILTE